MTGYPGESSRAPPWPRGGRSSLYSCASPLSSDSSHRAPVQSPDTARIRALTVTLSLLLLGYVWSSAHAASQPDPLGKVPQVRVSPHTKRISVIDQDDIQFSHLSTNEGLSQTRVDQIVQDDDGFLWFATQYGLDRYDGYNFKVFLHDPANEHSLSCVYIWALFKDRDGNLGIGCEQGGDRYDKTTERFVHYRIGSDSRDDAPLVFHIAQDDAGALWISTKEGLYRLDAATRRSTRYAHVDADSSSLR